MLAQSGRLGVCCRLSYSLSVAPTLLCLNVGGFGTEFIVTAFFFFFLAVTVREVECRKGEKCDKTTCDSATKGCSPLASGGHFLPISSVSPYVYRIRISMYIQLCFLSSIFAISLVFQRCFGAPNSTYRPVSCL